MRLSKVPLEMNFPKRNDTLLIQRDNNFVGMTFMNIILKGIGVIIGLFIFLAIIGALFGSHDTPTPAATTSKITETKTAYTQDGQNFVSKEWMDESIRAGIAKSSNYKEVQVPLNTVVLGVYAPDSGVSKQGETSIPAQQTQTSAPKPSQTLYPWGYAPGSMP